MIISGRRAFERCCEKTDVNLPNLTPAAQERLAKGTGVAPPYSSSKAGGFRDDVEKDHSCYASAPGRCLSSGARGTCARGLLSNCEHSRSPPALPPPGTPPRPGCRHGSQSRLTPDPST